jgi:hypothetical protein
MTELAERRRRAAEASRRREERIAFLFVLHGETPESLRVSVDGDENRAQNLYINSYGKPAIVEQKRVDNFLLCHLPGWMVIKFGLVQTGKPRLSDAVKWSDEQRAQWNALRPDLMRLRHGLQEHDRRRRGLTRAPTRFRFGESA